MSEPVSYCFTEAELYDAALSFTHKVFGPVEGVQDADEWLARFGLATRFAQYLVESRFYGRAKDVIATGEQKA